MIAAISMMQKRPDISVSEFRRHWLDPHGVMTAGLPGLRRYVQYHCISSLAGNRLADETGILGFPMLEFDSYEARSLAYTSPRIAECNVDSELFVGAVKRVVSEPREIVRPHPVAGAAKAIVLRVGSVDPNQDTAFEARALALPGLVGFVNHRILEQAAAPNSRIPELVIAVGSLAEVTFESAAALARAGDTLGGEASPDTAVFAVEEYRLL